MLMCALLTAAFGVASAMRARTEETSGRAELVLATATSRSVWLASHLSVALVGSALVLMAAGFGHGLAYGLTIADAGQISRLIGVGFVYLPAVWLVIALAVVGLGWLPRIAAALAWVAVGYCAIVALFGDSFELPAWFQNASPFTHTPEAPSKPSRRPRCSPSRRSSCCSWWAASPGSGAATWATDGVPRTTQPRPSSPEQPLVSRTSIPIPGGEGDHGRPCIQGVPGYLPSGWFRADGHGRWQTRP
jgi:hypothetical protein